MHNIKTPRFYIDVLAQQNHIGNIDWGYYYNEDGDINPEFVEGLSNTYAEMYYFFQAALSGVPNQKKEVVLQTDSSGKAVLILNFKEPIALNKDDYTHDDESKDHGYWWALFGHKANTNSYDFNVKFAGTLSESQIYHYEVESQINYNFIPQELYDLYDSFGTADFNIQYEYEKPERDGFSMVTFNSLEGEDDDTKTTIIEKIIIQVHTEVLSGLQTIDISGFSFGIFHDMPYSPDLKLNQGVLYDGVVKQKSKSGYNLSSSIYNSAPSDPFYLEDGSNPVKIQRTGRRFWNISYSFLFSDEIFPQSMGSGIVTDADIYGRYYSDQNSPTYGNPLHLTDVQSTMEHSGDVTETGWTAHPSGYGGEIISSSDSYYGSRSIKCAMGDYSEAADPTQRVYFAKSVDITFDANTEYTVFGRVKIPTSTSPYPDELGATYVDIEGLSDWTQVSYSNNANPLIGERGIWAKVEVRFRTGDDRTGNIIIRCNWPSTGDENYINLDNIYIFKTTERYTSENSNLAETGLEYHGEFTYDNITSADSLYSSLLHKTKMKLPFILQQDKNNFNPDQFTWVRTKKDELNLTQVTNGIYKVNLSLEESW